MIAGGYDFTGSEDVAFLSLLDSDGDILWTRTFDSTGCFHSILEDDEQNIVFNSNKFCKYNYVTDETIFVKELKNDIYYDAVIAHGNKNIIKLDDGYIISGHKNWGDYLLLFKTDLNGSVEANENTIIPVNKSLKYQNPFSESVKFEVVNATKSYIGNKIEIYNLKGQKVSTIKSNDKNLFWDAKSMPSGIYFLHLNNENKIYKILKVK